MAALERTIRVGQAIGPASERHVFAAATARRARVLWALGIGAGVLALAWLVALGLAVLGAGTLPGVLPADAARPAHRAPAHRAPAHRAPAQQFTYSKGRRPAQVPARPQHPAPQATRPGKRAPSTAAASSTPAAFVAPAPVATPQAPASRGQGWARSGWNAPPGRARRTQPPPGKGAGLSKRQADTSTTTTAPGQSGSHSPKKG
jgi:hypothetical protein